MLRLPDRDDDRGITLAETLVAGALLVVVTALAATLLVTGQRAAADTQNRGEAAESQRVVFSAVTRVLRTATSVQLSTSVDPVPAVQHGTDGRSVTVLANIDPSAAVGTASRPSKVTYTVDAAGTLTETVTPLLTDAATGTFTIPAPGGPSEKRRILATGILNPPGTPVFTYVMPKSVPPVTTCPAETGCAVGLSAAGSESSTLAARQSVRSISVNLVLQASTPRQRSATTFQSQVHLPSTGVLRAGS